MPVPLPNLDDRRWADLVDEGRALIPVYAPEWTDHNVHDPGITLMELLAWIAEMDVYQLDQVPPRHRLKFLSLVGIRPEPPRPSLTVVRLALSPGSPALALPATTELEASDPFGQPTGFRTLDDLEVVAAELRAVQVEHLGAFRDLTARWQRRESVRLFGDDPGVGTALYLGLSQTPPVGTRVSLRFTFGDLADGDAERRRLIQEQSAQRAACGPPPSSGGCAEPSALADSSTSPATPAHHSVRLVWEFLGGAGQWRPLDAAAGQVEDDTRAFTLDGRVAVTLPEVMGQARLGSIDAPLCYLRCRVAAGAYDAPPAAIDVALNAVAAEQAVPAGALWWAIAADATIEGPEPVAGALASFDLELGAGGAIARLRFGADEEAAFRILEYRRGSPAAGLLRIEAELLGRGSARPRQRVALSRPPVVADSVRVLTLEEGRWRCWALRADLDASGPDDRHHLLDPTLGVLSFGDGEHGDTVPLGATIVASYLATRAEAGTLAAEAAYRISTSPHNQAVLTDPGDVTARLALISASVPATGGAGAEPLAHAEGRAVAAMERPNRAVTLADYEALAKETPGVRLARVSARADAYPPLPCVGAPGMIAVLVLPTLPAGRPMPSAGLRRTIAAYLRRRRIIGTRVEVFGPTYVEVAVRAKVRAHPGTSAPALRDRITAALDRFLHPLIGGPGGDGWPFGRDVYRSEVLQVIDETDGVDHVLSLELIVSGGDARCGNVCLGPTGLVAASRHQIEIG